MNEFDSTAFLLGAGFNVDTASEASQSSDFNPTYKYPLVSELLEICFNQKTLSPMKSIEDQFQECIDKHELEPLRRLCKALMFADCEITPRLKSNGPQSNNIYSKFLRDFPKSPLMTFNYDSLPEILLLSEGSWSPGDGFGVNVKYHENTNSVELKSFTTSRRPVIHLHGSLYVYAKTYDYQYDSLSQTTWQKDKEKPEFVFDPYCVGDRFYPFERIYPGLDYTDPHDRIIAPIPNKAKGLKGEFIKSIYSLAEDYIRTAAQVVVIGYSFNKHDRASYKELLKAAESKTILLVIPEAESQVKRLRKEFPSIHWKAQNMTFKEWVESEYPGLKINKLFNEIE